MKRIAVLTSGGDAPGMNAAIRAVVRTGMSEGLEVYGVQNGYQGVLDGNIRLLSARDVGGIIQQGGTILGSARALEFKTPEGRQRGLDQLRTHGIEALVVIGGGGSQAGAYSLSQLGFPVIGVASTIDNDLVGSDVTIGVDTALNIALEAIDRLKVTASAYRRAFIVEVMGRDCGYLALMAGIAGGAEAVLIPEAEVSPHTVAEQLRESYARGKTNSIIVVAEGAAYNAEKLAQYFTENAMELGFEMRVTTLGHVQRGGAPTAYDRILATRLAVEAVERLKAGEYGGVVGIVGGQLTLTPYALVIGVKKPLDMKLLKLADILAI